jgi:hypothetical protein
VSRNHQTMFAGHALTVVNDGPVARWHLTKPDAPTVEITVTDRQIQVEIDGEAVHAEMDLTTFVGELTPDYLAEQFLVWQPDLADDRLRAAITDKEQEAEHGDHEAEAEAERLDTLGAAACVSPDTWQETELDPLAGYDRTWLDRLIAVHDRFRETYLAEFRLVDGRSVPR